MPSRTIALHDSNSHEQTMDDVVEAYRGVEIRWDRVEDESRNFVRVAFQCQVNGQTLKDDWIDGLRKKIDAALDTPAN
jgi:hypothetical protein